MKGNTRGGKVLSGVKSENAGIAGENEGESFAEPIPSLFSCQLLKNSRLFQ